MPELCYGRAIAWLADREPGRFGAHPSLPAGFVPESSLSGDPLPDVVPEHARATTPGGSTGRPRRILDAEGKQCPAGVVGEIYPVPPGPARGAPVGGRVIPARGRRAGRVPGRTRGLGWLAGIAALGLLVPLVAQAGGSAEIRRGAGKDEAIGALRAAGVERVRLDVHPAATAARPEEIDRLRESEGLRIALPRGGVRIGFDGERVAYLEVAASLPQYRERLAAAANRSEVLAALREILGREEGVAVRSCALRDRWVALSDLGAPERALLERYDAWSFYRNAWLGTWYQTLRFEEGRVARIERDWLPARK